MHVRRLGLTDFRSWPRVDLELAPGRTVFVGPNGFGKTNIIEALWYSATLGSHRVATDAPLIRTGAPRAVVPLALDSGAIATSVVTVPLIAAYGIALAETVPGRTVLQDGFGLIVLALFGLLAATGMPAAFISRMRSTINSGTIGAEYMLEHLHPTVGQCHPHEVGMPAPRPDRHHLVPLAGAPSQPVDDRQCHRLGLLTELVQRHR